MPIPVTCPSCLARFTVSDKYAGKQGPCPKCKQTITVPDKSQEVVIHAPETEGPKDSKGRPVLKPIRRTELNPSTIQIGIAIGVAVICLIAAIAARINGSTPTIGLALVAIGLAYPLASVGYTFFKDDELGGYIGKDRWIRVGICSAVFAVTWGLYWFLSYYFGNKSLGDIDTIQMAIFIGIMFAAGVGASLGTCELEAGQAFLHYSIYFVATLLLALIAGVPLAQPISGSNPKDPYGLPKPSAPILLPSNPNPTPPANAD